MSFHYATTVHRTDVNVLDVNMLNLQVANMSLTKEEQIVQMRGYLLEPAEIARRCDASIHYVHKICSERKEDIAAIRDRSRRELDVSLAASLHRAGETIMTKLEQQAEQYDATQTLKPKEALVLAKLALDRDPNAQKNPERHEVSVSLSPETIAIIEKTKLESKMPRTIDVPYEVITDGGEAGGN